MKALRNLIVITMLALLAACSSSTDSGDKAPAPATPPAAAPPTEPAPAPAAEPAKDAPKEEPKEAPKAEPAATAAKAAPKADAKPADKTPSPSKSNLKPGLYAHFQTNMGNFTAELNEKEAPGTVKNFAGLADGSLEWTDPRTGSKQKKPYYDGLTFHRVIDNFMIQGGDPLGNGTGGPGFTIKDEINNLKHDKVGVLAMARTSAPNSAGSQFYVTVTATPFLDGQQPPYVVFGQVVEGVDIVQKIGKTQTGPGDKPLSPVIMNKVTIERVK